MRYQLLFPARPPRLFGFFRLVESLQLLESTVTVSAMIAAAACGSPNPAPVLALKSPCTYTGFSEATVKPPGGVGLSRRVGRLPSVPSTSFNTWRAPVTRFALPIVVQFTGW